MHRSHSFFLSSTLLVFANVALAQDATTAAAAEAPAAPPATAPAEGEAPAPPACYPACREGFLCNTGVCISACNPACAAGQRCTDQAQCVADVPPPPSFPAPPSYPPPSYPPPGGEAARPAPRPNPGAFKHDGFLLRGHVGFGGALVQESGSALGDVDYSGGAITLSVDIGSAIGGDFSVFGRFALFGLSNPHWESAGADGTLQDQSISSVLLGGGASYHLMPINMYFALAAGLGAVVVSESDENEGDSNGESKTGLSINLDVGKEWWVASQLGLGPALRFWYSSGGYERGDIDLDRSLVGGALLFSITFQ